MLNLIQREPFEDLMRGFFMRPNEARRNLRNNAARIRVEVHETPAQYNVLAELPGVNKEDIHVHIDGPVVTIEAERTSTEEVQDGPKMLYTERFFGKLTRSFQLPQEVDENASTARFKEGVLELTLPKKAPGQARRLTIE